VRNEIIRGTIGKICWKLKDDANRGKQSLHWIPNKKKLRSITRFRRDMVWNDRTSVARQWIQNCRRIQSINQSINTFITHHSTEARATVQIMLKNKEKCLKPELELNWTG